MLIYNFLTSYQWFLMSSSLHFFLLVLIKFCILFFNHPVILALIMTKSNSYQHSMCLDSDILQDHCTVKHVQYLTLPCVFPSVQPYQLSCVDTWVLPLPCSWRPLLLLIWAFVPIRQGVFINSLFWGTRNEANNYITSVTSFLSSTARVDWDSRFLSNFWWSSSVSLLRFWDSSWRPLI